MAELRRIVRIDAAGTATVIRDISDGTNFMSVRGSFTSAVSKRQTTYSKSGRRFGGARAVGETHDNGEIGWKTLVKGASANACLANIGNLLGDLEYTGGDYYLEWRAEGATNSTYYEIRGPASYTPTYEWAQFLGSQSMYVDVSIPVAPLGQGTPQTIAFGSTTFPNTVALGTAILGDTGCPSLCDLSLISAGLNPFPVWGMIGWTQRPTTPLATSFVPFGVVEAEVASSLVGYTVQADAAYRGGSGLKATLSGSGGTLAAYFLLDPSTMQPDDFTRSEIDIEIWAGVSIPSTVVSPFLIVQAYGNVPFPANVQYAAEYGSRGHLLTKPSSGSARRFVKVGTVTYPVDKLTPNFHWAAVLLGYQAGSSGTFGLDYLFMVPAKQRALMPTGKPLDASFPRLFGSTGVATKTIRSDLSGRRTEGAGNPPVPDAGMGGSPIWLPPGNVDLAIKVSTLVPDDPTVDTTSETLSHALSGSLLNYPRYFLARSS